MSLLREFIQFAKEEKKWWLIPLISLLVIGVAVAILSSGSGISWALYPSR